MPTRLRQLAIALHLKICPNYKYLNYCSLYKIQKPL